MGGNGKAPGPRSRIPDLGQLGRGKPQDVLPKSFTMFLLDLTKGGVEQQLNCPQGHMLELTLVGGMKVWPARCRVVTEDGVGTLLVPMCLTCGHVAPELAEAGAPVEKPAGG